MWLHNILCSTNHVHIVCIHFQILPGQGRQALSLFKSLENIADQASGPGWRVLLPLNAATAEKPSHLLASGCRPTQLFRQIPTFMSEHEDWTLLMLRWMSSLTIEYLQLHECIQGAD